MNNSKIALKLTFIAFSILLIFYFLSERISSLIAYRAVITSAIFLYLPLINSRKYKFRIEDFGLNFKHFPEQLLTLAVSILVIFPFFIGGFILYLTYFKKYRFVGSVDINYFQVISFHILAAALPEEFFFRGFLQELFNRDMPRRFVTFGISWGPGMVISAFLFAIGHFIFRQEAWRIMVFFPGLLFGLLREKYDSIAVPVLLHAFSNIIVEILEYHFFP